jgi:hypothetical protein
MGVHALSPDTAVERFGEGIIRHGVAGVRSRQASVS